MADTVGGTIEFVGPATTNSSGNVAATGTITTTTAGGGGVGLLGGEGTTGDYATVGLYDWASTDTTAGNAGTTLIGGSQVTGFYTGFSGSAPVLAGNVDCSASPLNSHNTDTPGSIRFNIAGPIAFNPTSVTCSGGILVTPNVGAANVTIGGTAGELEPSRGGASSLVIWQNDILGILICNVNHTFNDAKSGAGTYILAGLGTIEFNFPNTYTGPTYINGSAVAYIANATAGDAALGAAATAAKVTLNGGAIVGGANFTLDNGGGVNPRPIALGNNGGGLGAVTGTALTVDGVVSGSGTLTIGIPASSANGNVVGQLPGTGTGTANTTATSANGTVALTGTANTYSGGTIIYNTTLSFITGALGSGGLTFNGGTLQWGGSTTTDISAQTVTINSAGATLDVNGNVVTLASSIGNSGSGALTVASTAA